MEKGILPRINRGKSTPDRKLTAGQARAIYKLLEGKYIDSKTQYSQRYLALERLGFSGTAQFSLFTAGIGNVIQRQNFIFKIYHGQCDINLPHNGKYKVLLLLSPITIYQPYRMI